MLIAEPVEKIKVARVRIIIDESEYEWTENGISSTSESEEISVGTVISWLSIHPGQMLSSSVLESWCRDSELRLKNSGYFYEASVMIVPPMKNPAERTVIVSVTGGYLWRYGGGNAWGMLGKEGLGGERAGVRLYVGWNRNGAEYIHQRVGGLPLLLGGSLFYFGPGDTIGRQYKDGNRFEGSFKTGWYFHPDLLAGIDTVESDFGLTDTGIISVQPYLSWNKYLESGSSSNTGTRLRLFMYPELHTEKMEAGMFVHAGLTETLVFALNGSIGLAPENLPEEVNFDLFNTDDRNVRSGYSEEDLSVANYLLGSAEIRQTVIAFTIPPAIDCSVKAFVFADGALLEPGIKTGDVKVVEAYGAGLRILFDNPVFAWFTFAYGVNNDGDGRFLFSGTAGF